MTILGLQYDADATKVPEPYTKQLFSCQWYREL